MLWGVLKEAAESWSAHKDSRQGAALAYYSVFSIGPLIVIAIAIAGFVFGRDAVAGQVAMSIKDLLGETGAKAIQAMLIDASRPRAGLMATLLGTGALLFAAIGVVVQLKDALNTVWEVRQTPGSGIWYYVRSYVLSFAGVLALGFLLLVSLLVTTALAAIGKYAAVYVDEWVLHLTNLVVSFAVITLLGPELTAVPAPTPGISLVSPITMGSFEVSLRLTAAEFFLGVEFAKMMAKDLRGRVLLDPLRASVPAGDVTARIEHVNGIIGNALDQQAIAAFAVAQHFGGARAIRQVANDTDEHAFAVTRGPADGQIHRKGRAVLASPDIDRGKVVKTAVMTKLFSRRHQYRDVLTDHLGGTIAEQLFAGRIEQPDTFAGVDQDDTVRCALKDGTKEVLVHAAEVLGYGFIAQCVRSCYRPSDTVR